MSRYDLAAEQADHALACAERLAEIRQLLGCPEGGEVAAVRRLIADARDPQHCYTCDRPTADCACNQDIAEIDIMEALKHSLSALKK